MRLGYIITKLYAHSNVETFTNLRGDDYNDSRMPVQVHIHTHM